MPELDHNRPLHRGLSVHSDKVLSGQPMAGRLNGKQVHSLSKRAMPALPPQR
jgi:hypothetical protein